MGQSKGSLKPVPGCPFMENEAVIVIKTKEVKNSEIKGYLADVFSIKN